MQNYALIETVLAGIFSTSVGYSEEEAIQQLRKDINTNPVFKAGFEAELRDAFVDKGISWRTLFAEHEVFFFDTEKEAADYARKMLWDIAFIKQ